MQWGQMKLKVRSFQRSFETLFKDRLLTDLISDLGFEKQGLLNCDDNLKKLKTKGKGT